MHSPRDRRMTKPVALRPLRPTGYDGMGPAADARASCGEMHDEEHRMRTIDVVVAPCI